MGFGQWLKDTGAGIANGAKQFGADIAGVGHQVLSMTLDAGKGILDGTYTALTDPKKFVNDVKNNIGEGLQHVSDSWTKGADTIGKGWSEMKDGRGLFNALEKTVNGVGQIASMGFSDVIDDHLEETMVEHRDELGNVIGYEAKEGTDYITKRMIENGSERRALVTNAEEEIAEAIADGDKARVSKLDSELFMATTGKDIEKAADIAMTVGTVASVVAGVAAAVPTGGTSLVPVGAVLAGETAGKIAIKEGAKVAVKGILKTSGKVAATKLGASLLSNRDIDLEELNVSDDISDAISEQVRALKESGRLSEDQVDRYTEVMSTYYRSTLYSSGDPNFAQNNGFESNEQMRDWLLVNNGLPTMSEAAEMPREELDAAYSSYCYDLYAADLSGFTDKEVVQTMADYCSAYAAGEMSKEDYTLCVARLTLEGMDMSEEHKDAYAPYAAALCLGQISADEFRDSVLSDPDLQGLAMDDSGRLDVGVREGGLELMQAVGRVSEPDRTVGVQPLDPELVQHARDIAEQGPHAIGEDDGTGPVYA